MRFSNNGDTCAKSCVFNNEKVTRHGEPINTNLDQIACTQYPQQQSFGLNPTRQTDCWYSVHIIPQVQKYSYTTKIKTCSGGWEVCREWLLS